jgi:hypothetical protein
VLQYFVVMPDYNVKRLIVSRGVQQTLDKSFRDEASAFRLGFVPTEFEAGYGPEEDEVFLVSPFDLPAQFVECVKNPHHCDHIKREELVPGAIKAVVGAEADEDGDVAKAIYKRIDGSKIIDRSKMAFVMHEENTLNVSNHKVFVVPDRVDAVYEGGDLYFFSHYTTKQFLPIDELFREATNSDVNSLLAEGTLVTDDHNNLQKILDSWSRRRIAMIMERPIWHYVQVPSIRQQATEFGISIDTRTTKDGREVIVLPDERKALKELLRVLNEDLLESQLSHNRWRVNSKKRVE